MQVQVVNDVMLSVSYLIAGADVHAPFQIFQNLVDVPRPRRSQETGVTVRLEETQKKYIFRNNLHNVQNTFTFIGCQIEQ